MRGVRFLKIFLSVIVLCFVFHEVHAQSFVPEYNNGNRITLSKGDTAEIITIDDDEWHLFHYARRRYYYYHHQNIHSAVGAYIGNPLDGLYVKHLRDGQLLEKGQYKSGLKHGVWKKWYRFGNICEKARWHKGKGRWRRSLYAEDGTLEARYKWKKNKWVFTRKYRLKQLEGVEGEKDSVKTHNRSLLFWKSRQAPKPDAIAKDRPSKPHPSGKTIKPDKATQQKGSKASKQMKKAQDPKTDKATKKQEPQPRKKQKHEKEQ